MSPELKQKVLKIAAQICWMHGEIAGNRSCQDWTGDTKILDSLTPDEKDTIALQYENYNSGGADFEPGYFPYDEMIISFIVANALDGLLKENS